MASEIQVTERSSYSGSLVTKGASIILLKDSGLDGIYHNAEVDTQGMLTGAAIDANGVDLDLRFTISGRRFGLQVTGHQGGPLFLGIRETADFPYGRGKREETATELELEVTDSGELQVMVKRATLKPSRRRP